MWKYFPQSSQPTPNEKKKGICRQKSRIRCSTYWIEKPGIPTGFCEAKTPAGNLVFFYHRENDLLNQKIRTIRVLDEFFFFYDVEAELFDNFAKISINDYP